MQTKLIAKSKYHLERLFYYADAPNPSLSVCVIVPARNEAKNIIKTLEALRLQTCSNGKPLPPNSYEVLLLANNCVDKTFLLAQKYKEQHPNFNLQIDEVELPQKLANIGTVRRLLMDVAYNRLCANGQLDGIIASTDGDSEVDSHWIHFIKEEISKGNDAVGGRILPHKIKCDARIYHLRDVSYRLLLAKAESMIDPDANDPWPRHFQYFGASLAVTCDMYHKCGRLPQVPYLEDGAFHRSLYLMDAKIRRSPHVKVYTSNRMCGRVEIGFSEQLKKWNIHGKTKKLQMAGSVEAQLLNYKIRKQLRDCWQNTKNGIDDSHAIKLIAKQLSLKPAWLQFEITAADYFGKLWESVLGQKSFRQWMAQYEYDMPITEAIEQLRLFTSKPMLYTSAKRHLSKVFT